MTQLENKLEKFNPLSIEFMNNKNDFMSTRFCKEFYSFVDGSIGTNNEICVVEFSPTSVVGVLLTSLKNICCDEHSSTNKTTHYIKDCIDLLTIEGDPIRYYHLHFMSFDFIFGHDGTSYFVIIDSDKAIHFLKKFTNKKPNNIY